jgi:hypothetical protein
LGLLVRLYPCQDKQNLPLPRSWAGTWEQKQEALPLI